MSAVYPIRQIDLQDHTSQRIHCRRSPDAISGLMTKSSKESPLRVVAGAVIDQGRSLVARRAMGGPDGGRWELPGGKVQPNESDAQALIRELDEELGITIEVTGSLGVSEYERPNLTIHLVGLLCRCVDGELEAREHTELRWARANELSTLDWAPADLPLVAALRTHLLSL